MDTLPSRPTLTAEQDELVHLTIGWLGFVRILVRKSARGVRFTTGDVERLHKAQELLSGVLVEQSATGHGVSD